MPRKLMWSIWAVAGAVGLSATERHDRFCVACHLHEDKYARFLGTPATDLTGPHHAKNLRCIDCHGGADPVMRLRVWTLAAVDTGRFLVGRYKEPDRKGVHDLLSRPGGGRMLGDVEVEDSPAMVGEHDYDEEHAQANGRNVEEVDRDQVLDVIGQELGLSGRAA